MRFLSFLTLSFLVFSVLIYQDPKTGKTEQYIINHGQDGSVFIQKMD